MSRSERPPAADDSEPSVRLDARTTPGFHQTVAIPRIELVLELVAGKPSGARMVVEGERCRIGSHSANDVTLADKRVSRFHCELRQSAGRWSLHDTGSLNGTFIAGVRVRDGNLPLRECRIELGESALRVRELHPENEEELPVWPNFGGLYGGSVPMRRLFGQIEKVARSESNVLVEGDSGTGKELVASELVQRGPRANGPFLIVDCSAIAPALIETELFGHAKGAFTGAQRDRTGTFEAAHGGTLFLDEIGELPLDLQPKLLRAIEAHEVRRIGENRPRKVDVRVIAATNRRLEREVNSGRFREDLYFRLSVVTLRLPPLRERLEDIPMLVDVFLGMLKAQEKARLFTPAVLTSLSRYDWPGNVRELRNYVERAIVFEMASPPPERVSASGPPGRAASRATAHGDAPVDIEAPFVEIKERVVEDFERRYLTALLQWAGGNVTRAARKAGMDRMYLHRLVQRLRLQPAQFKLEADSPEQRER